MENKSILVTGGLGFIGSHFVELLYKKCKNCFIDIVDKKDYCVSRQTEDLIFRKVENLAMRLLFFFKILKSISLIKSMTT